MALLIGRVSSELARYHAAYRDAPERAFAMYLLTGVPHPLVHGGEHAMDINDGDEGPDDSEDVVETCVTLVNEDALACASRPLAFSNHTDLDPSGTGEVRAHILHTFL
jgi:hypothetical protein